MDFILTYLSSLYGLLLIILLSSLLGIFWIITRNNNRKSEKIMTHFNGKSTLFGEIKFKYKKHWFQLVRLSSGRGVYGNSGSYPVLYIYLDDNFPTFFIGNVNSYKYWFLKTNNKITKLNDCEFFANLTNGLTKYLETNSNLTREISKILEKEFALIQLKHEWHVLKPFKIINKNVLRIRGLNETIYTSPDILEHHLNSIIELIQYPYEDLESKYPTKEL